MMSRAIFLEFGNFYQNTEPSIAVDSQIHHKTRTQMKNKPLLHQKLTSEL